MGGDRYNEMGKIGCCLEISKGFESPAARKPLFSDESSTSRATMAQGLPAEMGWRWQSGTGRLTPSDR